MRRTLILCVAVSALAVTGCQDTPNPVGPDITPEFAVMGVIASATGSGHFRYGADLELRTFSFNALTKGNGTTTGNWQIHNRTTDVVRKYEVACLTVVGDVAYVGGTRYDKKTGDVVLHAGFKVFDNGEGGNAPPDQTTFTHFVGYDWDRLWAFCADPGARADNWSVWDIEGGNVQVRSK